MRAASYFSVTVAMYRNQLFSTFYACIQCNNVLKTIYIDYMVSIHHAAAIHSFYITVWGKIRQHNPQPLSKYNIILSRRSGQS